MLLFCLMLLRIKTLSKTISPQTLFPPDCITLSHNSPFDYFKLLTDLDQCPLVIPVVYSSKYCIIAWLFGVSLGRAMVSSTMKLIRCFKAKPTRFTYILFKARLHIWQYTSPVWKSSVILVQYIERILEYKFFQQQSPIMSIHYRVLTSRLNVTS